MQTTKPETAQQRPTGTRMALLMLLYFIKIGAFTFGSGWSIIARWNGSSWTSAAG